MKLEKASFLAISYACKNYHYTKSVPAVSLAYSVFNEGMFCGVVCFGTGANPHIASPYNKWQGQVLELVRVALNGKHGETSKVVATSLKMLKKDAPLVDLVVSYADTDQKHLGIIYQATNWIYVGLQNPNSVSSFVINRKKMHRRTIGARGWKGSLDWLRLHVDKNAQEFVTGGKYKYLFPLNKKTRKLVEPLRQPYPKNLSV